MSEKVMLIDQSLEMEARVAVLNKDVLEEFDCEFSHSKSKKGNIYLAKVARIEPSLQAVFIDYGDERHGFLPLSNIHPSYYNLSETAKKQQEIASLEAKSAHTQRSSCSDLCDISISIGEDESPINEIASQPQEQLENTDSGTDDEDCSPASNSKPDIISQQYNVKDVIKRNQILLVQAIKDTRNNKGVAFTTYLSLPGRLSVLMPNTPKGKGVSKKISNQADRQTLKEMIQDLDIPKEMGLIIRTAALGKRKTEIKRDSDYLLRMWSDITEKVSKSSAPAIMHEEGDILVKALRDMYTSDISKVIVYGDEAFKKAKAFMKVMMPSHARRVVLHKKEEGDLFGNHGINHQIDKMYNPTVRLASGGSIIISQTEALVAIDVNSAKATRSKNFDTTSLKINLEAATEIAKQITFRNLSGLIVIDFIDMQNNSSCAQVETQLKKALKNDRANITFGKISQFGVLEMSRQRSTQSIAEKISSCCPNCLGSGRTPSVQFMAIRIIRETKEIAQKLDQETLHVVTSGEMAGYILNDQRAMLAEIESLYSKRIFFSSDQSFYNHVFKIQDVKYDICNSDTDNKSAKNKNDTKESKKHFDGELNKNEAREKSRKQNPDDKAASVDAKGGDEISSSLIANSHETKRESAPGSSGIEESDTPQDTKKLKGKRRRRPKQKKHEKPYTALEKSEKENETMKTDSELAALQEGRASQTPIIDKNDEPFYNHPVAVETDDLYGARELQKTDGDARFEQPKQKKIRPQRKKFRKKHVEQEQGATVTAQNYSYKGYEDQNQKGIA
ncbi:Rne/Rng family ribonuclease [Candidatus Hydrogenosomobacter endosymbioticus]|uniref:Ribonuclease G n=1 Tax=Candidatus Hydrogenosomobacter endosymbioticus TaxID=2558174 RepID=A0ABN6L393_9PROT|nr:ribonuclease E/G [Candidatus Hydrogenosomobacter endosymbioticus]BDB96333.1 ribonuclease E [Candidatus Hydrogenosomobacter endosymbioticus]